MPKYLIEREIPNAAAISRRGLEGNRAALLRRTEAARSQHPVGAELRDRGQDHLCVHCPQRRHNS